MNRTAWMSLAKTGLKEITHQIICIAQFHLYKVPKQKEIMWFRDANVGGKTIKNYFSKKKHRILVTSGKESRRRVREGHRKLS